TTAVLPGMGGIPISFPGISVSGWSLSSILANVAGVGLLLYPTELADGTLGREMMPRTMFHYTPKTLNGALKPGNYLTIDGNLTSADAIRQLALPYKLGTQLNVYMFQVYPGQYVPAPNSIQNTNFVAPANG